jgi:hypothetical protein
MDSGALAVWSLLFLMKRLTKRTGFAIDFESTVLPSTLTRDSKTTFLVSPSTSFQRKPRPHPDKEGVKDLEVIHLGARKIMHLATYTVHPRREVKVIVGLQGASL